MDSSDSEGSEKGIRYKTESTRVNDEILEENLVNKEPSIDVDNESSFGPALPPHLQKNIVIGPALPPNLKNSNSVGLEGSSSSQKNTSIGPALPPHLQKYSNDKIEEQSTDIGPALPPHLQLTQTESLPSKEDRCIGPVIPHYLKQRLAEISEYSNEESDEDTYGPMPEGAAPSRAHIELEERALQMKIDKLNPKGDSEPIREEWMLELPAVKAANLGLGPRQFRAKAGPDLSDRSSWTDTPEDRAKKREKKKEPLDIKKEAELKEIKKRDREQEIVAKKHKRKEESLVDSHMKKVKKKDDSSGNERRPFNRETDLQVNRFDEAQKKAVLKKAQLLDTRFSAGQSKFL